jgi:hypothetical protein
MVLMTPFEEKGERMLFKSEASKAERRGMFENYSKLLFNGSTGPNRYLTDNGWDSGFLQKR